MYSGKNLACGSLFERTDGNEEKNLENGSLYDYSE